MRSSRRTALEDAGDVQGKVTDRELAMAQQLIGMLSAPFEPERYHDEYREQLIDLIERKVAGEEISLAPPPKAPKAAPDLMAALQASVDALAKEQGATTKPAAKPRARKAPANKPKAAQRS